MLKPQLQDARHALDRADALLELELAVECLDRANAELRPRYDWIQGALEHVRVALEKDPARGWVARTALRHYVTTLRDALVRTT